MTYTIHSHLKSHKATDKDLPLVPEKRYFTISEAAFLCGVKPHVLRYWESEFKMLRPNKRRGNRRYYQSRDIAMVRRIRKLLYEEGFTIEGARTQLQFAPAEINHSVTMPKNKDVEIKKVIAELEEILQKLRL